MRGGQPVGCGVNAKLELGRIAGIPIYLDMFFVLVLFFFSHRYFTSGDTMQLSAGIIIIAGIIASILLHELAHALVAWLFKVRVSHIELTGLGGLIEFDSSLPRAALPRMAIFLAGPAMNYALYLAAIAVLPAATEAAADGRVIAFVLIQLAWINLFFCIFNLLPGFPLDGGHTLDAALGKIIGDDLACRVVGVLGILVAILIALYAIQGLPGSIFLLLLAFFIGEANWSALQNGRGQWRQ